jgi:prepilin-type N-terminal cleavage/methylation domain-containing protein
MTVIMRRPGLTTFKRSAFGFTLAELLIALAILGVIATFTIPKVLSNQSDTRKAAVMKETIGAISELVHRGWSAKLLNTTYSGSYIMQYINATRICNTNSATQGCWSMADPTPDQSTEPGFMLSNGSVVAGISDSVNLYNTFIVDWNGAAGPNTEGSDQIVLRMCYGNAISDCLNQVRPGTISAAADYPASVTFWKQIFQ